MVKTSQLKIEILKEEISFSSILVDIEYSVSYEKDEWTSSSFSECAEDIKIVSIEDRNGKEILFDSFPSEVFKEIEDCVEDFILYGNANACIG